MDTAVKRFLLGPWPVLVVFLLLASSLAIMAEATQSTGYFYPWRSDILHFNIGLVALLLVLVASALTRLALRIKARETGSRLTVRIARMFVGFTVLPTVSILAFSIWLISIGIDSWFDVGVDAALDKAWILSQSSLSASAQQRQKQVEGLLSDTGGPDSAEAAARLTQSLVQRTGALEAVLLDASGAVLAGQHGAPDAATASARLQLPQEASSYSAQIEHPQHGHVIYLLRQVPSRMSREPLVLHALYPASEQTLRLINSVEEAFATYRTLLLHRRPLIDSLNVLIAFTTVMGLLFALWAALHFSQKILSPIPELARGINAVASGEYSRSLPTHQNDELGQLTHAFNSMIRRLADSRNVAETHRRTIEQQRQELETLLETMPSGVISVDHESRLRMANPAAAEILGHDLRHYIGHLPQDFPAMPQGLRRLWEIAQSQDHRSWSGDRKIEINDGRTTLLYHNTMLPQSVGSVVVFVDITSLQQAQRQEAWGDAARRLAHEIKNPLTPIRLSAERMQHKLEPTLKDESADLLRNCTATIVTQVESLRDMLNEFSEYASVEYTPEPLDIDQLIREVLELYRATRPGIRTEFDSRAKGLLIEADRKRLRQLLHNVIKNALEAQDGQATGFIRLDTELQDAYLVLRISDNGPGFDPHVLPRIFEPYVTTKPQGNGLGLAIVHKIVQDHQGLIRVYNASTGGCVEVKFPLSPNLSA